MPALQAHAQFQVPPAHAEEPKLLIRQASTKCIRMVLEQLGAQGDRGTSALPLVGGLGNPPLGTSPAPVRQRMQKFLWEWQDEESIWVEFEEPQQASFEAAFAAGKTSLLFTINHGQWRYELDITDQDNMYQINFKSKKRRPVRRTLVGPLRPSLPTTVLSELALGQSEPEPEPEPEPELEPEPKPVGVLCCWQIEQVDGCWEAFDNDTQMTIERAFCVGTAVERIEFAPTMMESKSLVVDLRKFIVEDVSQGWL